MKRIAALTLPFAALFASASLADEKPLFVYVSPNPIGVNDFLKLGKIGTERVAEALGGVAKTYESYGIPYAESRDRFTETLEIIQQAWARPAIPATSFIRSNDS